MNEAGKEQFLLLMCSIILKVRHYLRHIRANYMKKHGKQASKWTVYRPRIFTAAT